MVSLCLAWSATAHLLSSFSPSLFLIDGPREPVRAPAHHTKPPEGLRVSFRDQRRRSGALHLAARRSSWRVRLRISGWACTLRFAQIVFRGMASSVLRSRLKSAIRVAGLGAEMALSSVRSRLNAARNGEPPPRDPYVQNVSASSAVIAWTSEEPDVGLVGYGKTPWLGRQEIDARVDRRHVVTLSELESGSTYYYRAGG